MFHLNLYKTAKTGPEGIPHMLYKTIWKKPFLLGILKKTKTKKKTPPNPAQACFSKYQIHYYAHWLVKYLQTSVSYCPDTEAVLPSSSTPRVETSTWVLFTFRE